MHSFAWRPLEDSRWRQAMMAYFGCFVPMCWVGNQASSVCCSTTQTASCATIRMLAGLEWPDKMPCSPCLSEGRGSWRQERTAGAMEKAIVHSTASKREYTATCPAIPQPSGETPSKRRGSLEMPALRVAGGIRYKRFSLERGRKQGIGHTTATGLYGKGDWKLRGRAVPRRTGRIMVTGRMG